MELRIAALREAKHMTQTDLAKQIGSTLRKVSSWERGETPIRLEDAALIADVFECTLDELAGRQWPRPPTALASDESHLLSLYRDTDQRGRAAILRTAEGEAGMEEKPASGDGSGAVSEPT